MKLIFMVIAFATVFVVNCLDFPDLAEDHGPNIEAQILSDGLRDKSIGPENQNVDEEAGQLNEIGDMSLLLRSKWCKRRDGKCRRRSIACGKGTKPSPYGRPYCTSKKRRCCYPAKSSTTAAPTTTTPVKSTTPKSTTATPGSTSSPHLKWLTVGADRFVKYNNTMNWTDARAACRKDGLDLYEPKNAVDVSKYLEVNYFNSTRSIYFWLGGRGNTTHQVWFSGNVVPKTAPWYGSYGSSSHKTTNHCMLLFANRGNADKKTVFGAYDCSSTSYMRPLCG